MFDDKISTLHVYSNGEDFIRDADAFYALQNLAPPAFFAQQNLVQAEETLSLGSIFVIKRFFLNNYNIHLVSRPAMRFAFLKIVNAINDVNIQKNLRAGWDSVQSLHCWAYTDSRFDWVVLEFEDEMDKAKWFIRNLPTVMLNRQIHVNSWKFETKIINNLNHYGQDFVSVREFKNV